LGAHICIVVGKEFHYTPVSTIIYNMVIQLTNKEIIATQPVRKPPATMPSTLGYCVLALDTEGPPAVGLAEAKPESEKFWLKRK
jgi:hypothetical protein